MSGYTDLNYPAFAFAAAALRSQDMTIVSPHEVESDGVGEWDAFMTKDLVRLIGCGGIVLLRGWSGSKGSRLELHVALELGFAVRYFNEQTGELLEIT